MDELSVITIPRTVQLSVDIHLTANVNISAATARRKVNAFLATHVGNLLLAGEPALTIGERIIWRVPIDLTSPKKGRIGKAGEIDVDVDSGELLVSHQQLEGIQAYAEVICFSPRLIRQSLTS